MSRAFTFVPGRGVVRNAELAPKPEPIDTTGDVARIVRSYEEQGLKDEALFEALDRHGSLLASTDVDVAKALTAWVKRRRFSALMRAKRLAQARVSKRRVRIGEGASLPAYRSW